MKRVGKKFEEMGFCGKYVKNVGERMDFDWVDVSHSWV